MGVLDLLADRLDPPDIDVFAILGYEPNCLPRLAARKKGKDIPLCGQCPQEQFHAAVEFDVLYGGAAGGGKALHVDTPIPTPTGWTTMGELKRGDLVFDENGQPCRVTLATKVMLDHPCFEVGFEDGSTLIADADHQWLTFTAADRAALTRRTDAFREARRALRPSRATGRRSEIFTASISARNSGRPPAALAAPTGAVRTTEQIAATLHSGVAKNHAIPVARALELPTADLPIDPYVLGAWLGDGFSIAGKLSCGDLDKDHFLAELLKAEHEVNVARQKTAWTLGVVGLTTKLRHLGVLRNKHIPLAYLRASTAQRLALLQGLMDTDGTANLNGSVEFTTTRRELGDGVHELALSLGHKASVREGVATLQGRIIGPKWRIKWTPHEIVFRLPRKVARQRTTQRGTQRWRYIVDVRPVTSVPVRCIQVASPNHLYLAGKAMVPTHNTIALLMEGLRACVRFPGIRVGAFRRSYDELEESLLKELAQVDFASELGARWNAGKHVLSFPNGSVMRFRYLERVKDATRRQGGEYQLVLLDERTLLPPQAVSILVDERIRTSRWDIPVLGVRSGTNPGGPGHAEVRARYIDATGHGAKTITDEHGRTVRFIQAKVEHNPLLVDADPGYILRLASIPDPARRKAMQDGDWDTFAGQMFSEWRRDRHVIPDMLLPAGWARYAGVDWGYAAPWAVVWAAIDEDHRLWVYRQRYQALVGEHDQARLLLEDEHTGRASGVTDGQQVDVAEPPPVLRAADPSMWSSRGDAEALNDAYLEEGCVLEAANNDRIAGWQRIHTYLADGPACPHHRAHGWETCPRLHVMERCVDLIEHIPNAPYSDTKTEDMDAGYDRDHDLDALRYLVMAIGTQPTFFFPGEVKGKALDGTPLLEPVGETGFAWPDGDNSPWNNYQ